MRSIGFQSLIMMRVGLRSSGNLSFVKMMLVLFMKLFSNFISYQVIQKLVLFHLTHFSMLPPCPGTKILGSLRKDS